LRAAGGYRSVTVEDLYLDACEVVVDAVATMVDHRGLEFNSETSQRAGVGPQARRDMADRGSAGQLGCDFFVGLLPDRVEHFQAA
jgi:hypothetical protein